jgi:4-hydroxy-2-oxoheptanedioate aldolase
MKGIKQRLNNGEVLLGTFLSLGNALSAKIIANAGFDWVIVDIEHGLGSEADVINQLLGLKNTSVSAIIRVEGYQRQRINRVLDAGADGVMCPRIENAEEALLVARAMQYPPEGTRGVAKMIRAAKYGDDFDAYRKAASEELLGVIQIETKEALNHLDAIAAIEGVDVLFIGPSDLSMALGIFGQTTHPLFIETVDKIIAAAKRAGKHVGILLANPADLKKYHDLGIQFFACGTDASFLNTGAKQTIEALKKSKASV